MSKIVYAGGCGEITEKKSRFIATVRPVHSEEEANAFFAEMKKKYWDARHNCTTFITGTSPSVARCSDDGEPAGTAGRPMLEVLSGEGITDVAVNVTRYFGGVLLGTGGLVRAYQAAVKAGLEGCKILEQVDGFLCSVHTDYNDYGKLSYLLAQEGYSLKDTVFETDVCLKVCVPADLKSRFDKMITDATGARAVMEFGDPVRFGIDRDEVIIL